MNRFPACELRVRLAFSTLMILSVFLSAGLAQAQAFGYSGWGVRGGVSSDPDQFVLGGHVDLGELAKNVRLIPNADIGFGDDLTVFTLNGDVVYRIALENAGRIYFGGALGLVYAKFDQLGIDTSSTDLGIAAVGGYQFPVEGNPIFVDLKIGITDEYPDLKLMLGYTFLP